MDAEKQAEDQEAVYLPGGRWRLWEQFSLRGPGFPVGGVLDLAPVDLSVYADKFAGGVLSGPDWVEFEGVFGEVAARTAVRLQEVAGSSDFTAAVAWQNRTVLRTGLRPFLGWVPSASNRSSMPRQREELVAHYWQRFCVKNDTIGFFGPVGWGRVDRSVGGVEIDAGEGLTESSSVFFSSWSIDALARTLSADGRLMAWIPPRRIPFARLERRDGGGVVQLPARPEQPVPAELLPLLELVDGRRTLGDLARQLSLPADRAEERLRELVRRRWVTWRLEVPSGARPDRELRAVLERVGDPELRRGALEPLEVLERGRERVEAAGRDASALCEALAALEEDFTRITDTASQRAKGTRTAPNRSLVYSDTRRSATARLSTAVLDELTPLSLCLTAVGWLTSRYAESMRARIRESFDRVRGDRPTTDLASLWFACLPAPHAASMPEADRIGAELRDRWARIIDAPEGARRVQLSSADIADRVREEFDGPRDGWSLSRYVSPDVLIMAKDAASVERGDFELVLGELHIAMNTVAASLFVNQHPAVEELIAETGRDFPGPRLMPMLPKELPLKWSARSRPALDRPEDYFVAVAEHTSDPHRDRTVLSAEVTVTDRDGRLTAVLPDGSEFDVLDVFSHALTNRVMDRFALRIDADHVPRVAVDKLVVSRESWRFTGGDLEFAEEKSEARRYVRARNWRGERGLPRYVFVVSPTEPRPFYVDFDAPVYVNILAKAARRLARKDPQAKLTVTEMLPSPEHAWLTDDQGNAYTSELRFVAVDQEHRQGGVPSW
ncbi:lantibiotic dehydratase [[Kitasatospora] papulosa]|uniref:lantibiotic dehydratase n=2 Tax=Streptomyces TaxID=1883 RepID=UPI0036A4CE21